MAEYLTRDLDLKGVADAIRTKGGTSAPLAFPDEFAAAIQAIPVVPEQQEKEITITENGDYPITADVGKVLSKVLARVAVPTGGGGVDPAPFKAIEVLRWTPASDTDKNVFQVSINPMACFFTAVPAFDQNDTGKWVGWGAAIAANTPLTSGTDQMSGMVFPTISASIYEAGSAWMQRAGKAFQLSVAYIGMNFKAGREYIITVFEI